MAGNHLASLSPTFDALSIIRANEDMDDVHSNDFDLTPPDVKVCRVCREHTSQETMIAPCLCVGSQRWIHDECWRRSGENCIIHPASRNENETDEEDSNGDGQLLSLVIAGAVEMGRRNVELMANSHASYIQRKVQIINDLWKLLSSPFTLTLCGAIVVTWTIVIPLAVTLKMFL